MPLGDQNNFNVINFIIDLMGETKGKIRFGYISISDFPKCQILLWGLGGLDPSLSQGLDPDRSICTNSKLCKNSSENDNITIFVC